MHTTPKSCAQQSVAIFAYIAAAGMLSATVAPESELEATKPTVQITKVDGTHLRIDWSAHPHVYYFVEGSNDLINWIPVKLFKDNVGIGSLTHGITVRNPKEFQRLSLDHDVSYTATTGGLNLAEAYAAGTDPNQIDSDGDGESDSVEIANGTDPNYDETRDDPNGDYDEDGLTNAEEHTIETFPKDADSDDDNVIDGEDGWPHCKDLAPARLAKPSYVVIPIHEGSSSTRLYFGEINNNTHALFATSEDGASAHYYFNWSESESQLLPEITNSAEYSYYGDYFGLTDQNYFLRDGVVNSPPDGDYPLPALFLDGDLQFEISSLVEFPPLDDRDPQEAYAYVNLVLPNGRIRGIQDDWYDGPAEAAIEWDTTGEPFAMPNSFDFATEYAVYAYAVNSQGVGLAHAEGQNAITLEVWDNYFGVWKATDDSFITLKTVPANEWWNYEDFPEDSRINNKNTITTQGSYGTRLWVDKRAGIRNDQSVNANLTISDLEVIDWEANWGDAPPINLNIDMRGFDTTRIWQNAQWLEVEELIPSAMEPNPQWSNIQIYDMNDHGNCIAQATNTDGKQCVVLLLKMDVEYKFGDETEWQPLDQEDIQRIPLDKISKFRISGLDSLPQSVQDSITWEGTFGEEKSGLEVEFDQTPVVAGSDGDTKELEVTLNEFRLFLKEFLVYDYVLGIHSNTAPGHPDYDSGHAWISLSKISFENGALNIWDMNTYGLYPDFHSSTPEDPGNLNSDVRLNIEGSSSGGYDRYYLLSPSEKDRLLEFVEQTKTWSPLYNCTDFATEAVDYAVGESIDPHEPIEILGYNLSFATPRTLSAELGSFDTTTLEDPDKGGEEANSIPGAGSFGGSSFTDNYEDYIIDSLNL
ncbi:hypothetical protein SH580_04725 [Coraliomargarita algicola]|uniref:Uncharacterized protein n=1 Tax=Coraliomargarita algicola TaxID=3092156 RepID=A0ABZ0RQF9_9BACT|nr:hypothetical protein [Coraliomargarita sp. J2-16]WPJ97010.1 hypothetical protein SH580_04725 [Coraliomargarita sp. J2-16]